MQKKNFNLKNLNVDFLGFLGFLKKLKNLGFLKPCFPALTAAHS